MKELFFMVWINENQSSNNARVSKTRDVNLFNCRIQIPQKKVSIFKGYYHSPVSISSPSKILRNASTSLTISLCVFSEMA